MSDEPKPDPAARLRLEGVAKAFPGGGGVRDVSLALAPGDAVALIGPSGSGKTTLLRVVAGLDRPDAGRVFIDGTDVTGVPPHLRGVAFVPQKPALYPQMSVRELISSPVPRSPAALPVGDVIPLLKLEPLLSRRPHELSGGERQRVSLARAVVRGASIWLLDEPFAPLDPPFRAEFRKALHLIAARCAATILFVTHDPVDAWALGRRVGVLGDGRLQALGPPEDLAARPGNRFVAFCLGRFVFSDGTVSDGRFGSDDGSAACAAPIPGPRRVTRATREAPATGPDEWFDRDTGERLTTDTGL